MSTNFYDITSESAALYTSHILDDAMDDVYEVSKMYLFKNWPFYKLFWAQIWLSMCLTKNLYHFINFRKQFKVDSFTK